MLLSKDAGYSCLRLLFAAMQQQPTLKCSREKYIFAPMEAKVSPIAREEEEALTLQPIACASFAACPVKLDTPWMSVWYY